MKKIFFVYFMLMISCFNKAMAELQILVDRQAEITINGKKFGTARPNMPLNISTGLPNGKAEIKAISNDDNRQAVRMETIEPEQWQQVVFSLNDCCYLTIRPQPKDAKIRLMNIPPVYRDGIKLAPGKYRVRVDHDGFKSYDEWLDINQVQQVKEVKLNEVGYRDFIRPPVEPVQVEPVPELVITKEPEMILVNAGCFYMGSPLFEEERITNEQRHKVCIQYNFKIGKYEVTFAEYDEFAKATNRKLPSDNGWGRVQRPVINISWHDAVAYAEWLSQKIGKKYRLPMEMEWEYAARAGTTTAFWSGDCIDTNQANYDGIIHDYNNCGAVTGNYNRITLPIGELQPNNLGLFDIAGNVLEWTCSTYEDKYMGAEQRCASNTNSGDNARRAVRGGSWMSTPWGLRSAARSWAVPNDFNNNLGFRLVEDL